MHGPAPQVDGDNPIHARHESSPHDLARTHAGRYLLLEHLGSGGMGHVYRAYDPELAREVALKFLRGANGSEAIDAVLHEARLMAGVSHPHVLAVHDLGYTDDRAFIAMELVRGVNLHEWLTHSPRPWTEVVAKFRAAGAGLAAAHAAGLVHRDFKPSNVLLSDNGAIKVADFGVAKHASVATRTAQPGHEVVGTTLFRAPELQHGSEANAHSDQYSFCLALHTALFPKLPRAHPAVPTTGAAVPRWLRRAVERGLHPNPARRWPSMHALVREFDRGRQRQYRTRWVAGSVVLASLLGWSTAAATAAPTTCDSPVTTAAAIWNPVRQHALDTVFRQSPTPATREGFARVVRGIDRYVHTWQKAKLEICTARESASAPELFDAQLACVDRGLQRVDGLLQLLTEGDEAVLREAVVSITRLPDLERCRPTERERPTISLAANRAEVEAVQARLSNVYALRDAALYARAREQANTLDPRVRQLAHPPLQAEFALLQAELEHHAGDGERAYDLAHDAYLFATAHGDARSAFEAALQLILLATENRRDPALALEWSKHASALAERDGASAGERARLWRYTAHARFANREFAEASALLYRAYDLLRQHDVSNPAATSTVVSLGQCGLEAGHYDRALLQFQAAWPRVSELYGEAHPRAATLLANMGRAYAGLGQPVEARELFERALTIIEAAYGSDSDLASLIRAELDTLAPPPA